MKNILVTGASGFLGESLVRELYKMSDINVYAISSRDKDLLRKYPDIKVNNFNDFIRNKDEFPNIDLVFNCSFSRTSEGKELAKSLEFTAILAETCANSEVKGFVNISSQSVYNQQRESAAIESSIVMPDSKYAIAKYATEVVTSTILSKSETSFTNIRLASLSGIDFNHRLTSRMVKKAIESESLNVNNGSQKIAYLDVKDATHGLLQLIKSDPKLWKSVYNLGIKNYYYLIEIAEKIKCLMYQKEGKEIIIDKKESDDYINLTLNTTSFSKDFNWSKHWDIEKDLEELYLKYRRIQ
ncbi:NAD-dependent epimerase/dehydratase family protein [Salinicoccus roseus]|uniref:NAD-dependent epimerase/dehydratase family protein n=1 Tax=Salinicoccus roseus TaxID=45670 RepID=UPI001EF4F8C5|nr:NAD(P)-dependent oxidoreductase [Salinicoccus roseus]